MKLQKIEKSAYRQMLNKVIVAFIISFAVLAIVFGQILIALLSQPNADNFWLNFTGVVIALVCCLSAINSIKNKDYMREVLYVWELKKQINFIYRKLAKIKLAGLQQGDIDALIILKFYYKACHQLYTLDDNTITIETLNKEQAALESYLDEHQLNVNEQQYQAETLKKY